MTMLPEKETFKGLLHTSHCARCFLSQDPPKATDTHIALILRKKTV